MNRLGLVTASSQQSGRAVSPALFPDMLTPEWRAWRSMCYRCRNVKYIGRKYYFDKGIKVDHSFLPDPANYRKAIRALPRGYVNFLKCVGRRPSKQHVLGRMDKSGDYRPGNIKWMHSSEFCKGRGKPEGRFNGVAAHELMAELKRRGYDISGRHTRQGSRVSQAGE
jgi:hypothetical protein